jgi:hypothetical protein
VSEQQVKMVILSTDDLDESIQGNGIVFYKPLAR